MDNRLRYLSGLRYFESAARMKSYSRAAEELYVSQAAVSQKIRQLEQDLNCKLFVRQGREMTLTDKGRTLFRQVSLGFEHIVTGLNQLQSEPLNGVLCVSAPPSFSSRWLLPRLWRFTCEYPGVPIKILTSCLAPDIKRGEVDIAIWQGENMENDQGLRKQFLKEEAVYPFCSPELAESMQFSSPEQLMSCWLIHYDSNSIQWQAWFSAAGTVMEKHDVQWMEVGTFDLALSAVLAGHGACLATDLLTQELVDKGLLVKPFDIALTPGIRFDIYDDPNSPRRTRVEAFRQWLLNESTPVSDNEQ